MTVEQQKRYVAALIRERRVVERKGLDARVEAIDAELRRLGVAGAAPAKRAEKRAR